MSKPNTICGFCGKEFYKRPKQKEKDKHHHCCKECYYESLNIEKKFCLACEKELVGDKRINTYCDKKCMHKHHNEIFIENWKNGIVDGQRGIDWKNLSRHIRRYMFEKYDNKCCMCGWSETNKFSNTIPLEIDHIDGDSNNNNEENLRLICPNCHSLTKTYKGANRGNGRDITWIPKKK